MSQKAPPVPPANQSPKGSGDKKQTPTDTSLHRDASAPNPDKQGQSGNTKVNTTHQGHQQDR
jgi:hypothetical protein